VTVVAVTMAAMFMIVIVMAMSSVVMTRVTVVPMTMGVMIVTDVIRMKMVVGGFGHTGMHTARKPRREAALPAKPVRSFDCSKGLSALIGGHEP